MKQNTFPEPEASNEPALVDATHLLERLWADPDARPSLRWLRSLQYEEMIPHARLGRRVCFAPAVVAQVLLGHEESDVAERLPLGFVNAERLLRLLWPISECRPSVEWLRTRARIGEIAAVRRGRVFHFSPRGVWRSVVAKMR